MSYLKLLYRMLCTNKKTTQPKLLYTTAREWRELWKLEIYSIIVTNYMWMTRDHCSLNILIFYCADILYGVLFLYENVVTDGAKKSTTRKCTFGWLMVFKETAPLSTHVNSFSLPDIEAFAWFLCPILNLHKNIQMCILCREHISMPI